MNVSLLKISLNIKLLEGLERERSVIGLLSGRMSLPLEVVCVVLPHVPALSLRHQNIVAPPIGLTMYNCVLQLAELGVDADALRTYGK